MATGFCSTKPLLTAVGDGGEGERRRASWSAPRGVCGRGAESSRRGGETPLNGGG